MTTDRAIRASDHDREQVVEFLRTQHAEGRLTLDEFDERMAAAYAAKTWGDLLDLTGDLPPGVRLGSDLVAAQNSATDQRPRPQRPLTWLPMRFVPLVPLLVAGTVLASITWGGLDEGGPHDHHGLLFLPVWLLIAAFIFLRRGMYTRGRGRGPFR
ncbi:MAG TPA: DUF1707 domain-containing protein [Streptosporangiaceae bacterium]|nr:DUF1707 domain-containing protein [Streptosporangiaceae bacterium]